MESALRAVALSCLFAFCQAATKDIIAPLSVPPSLFWDGDDGSWSTFYVQVGSPGQALRLLPGTSASAGSTPWVIVPEGCTEANPNLTNCVNDRGGLFYSNKSTTWSTQGLQNGADGATFSLPTYEENFLGLGGNGSYGYGYDNFALGLKGGGLPTLQHQLITMIWTDDYFLGSLGLSPVPFNFTNLDDPIPSMLANLRNQSLIPSSSWGYTAGAYYQNFGSSFGSLTLGGYDASRFQPNNVTFAFGADFSRDLVVGLQSITYNAAGSEPLMASSVDIFIDSMVTEIWLPTSVCEVFETTFNLTWNTQGQLYLIDDAAHQALLAEDPTFTFTLGQPSGSNGSDTVDIALPYAAFDLNLTAPIVGNNTRYFPLKRADNSSQLTLGRTFLQEAYVTADYDRRNFSVAQALFPPTSAQQQLVAIEPPKSKKRERALSAGAIAGIVIGAVVAAALASLIALMAVRRRKKLRKTSGRIAAVGNDEKASLPNSYEPLEEIDGVAVHEFDGRNFVKPELSSYGKAGGRHELVAEEAIHEIGINDVAELDTTRF